MKPDRRFLQQSQAFWANVRIIGQEAGYSVRGESAVKVPQFEEVELAYKKIGLGVSHLGVSGRCLTPLGEALRSYFEYRAKCLNEFVEPRLMDATRAKKVFKGLRARSRPKCPLPMNKQKGVKKAPAYLTGIVNMLIEANSGGLPCDYDPRQLTTITRDKAPLRALARRVDGAFPSPVNPVAVWEIKEYYYTTTFGSRVADGVYESLLDGMELADVKERERVAIRHYLIVDAYYTWWDCGKSYLCRLVDMLNMGYVDEVLFGYEVVERLPAIVQEWVALAKPQR